MAPKSRSKKSAAPDTLKNWGKQTPKRKQTRLAFSPNHMGEPRPDGRQPSHKAVKDLLIDMSARLSINEQCVRHLWAEKMEEREK